MSFGASLRTRFRTAFGTATLGTSVLPAILTATPPAARPAGNAMRISSALFANDGRAGFRFGGSLCGSGALLVFRILFRGLNFDTFDLAQNHGLNIEIFFLVEKRCNGRTGFALHFLELLHRLPPW